MEESSTLTEFSWRAVILGAIFGALFGAVSVYVGLRAGLTVSASIPIAVLSISILRAFGRSTILENNIVQTTGSAGESVAAGVIFTLPALIFLGFSLNTEYWRVFFLALIGGWLGVLFMIPLRRQLIVKEHGNLTFPEGTACADVLVAGEKRRIVRRERVLGARHRRRLHVADELDADVAGPAGISAQVAAGRVVPRRDHVGVSRRRLHHRSEDCWHDFCRRRVFVARPDARNQIFRAKHARAALSLDDSHRADVARRALVELHSPDRRGGRGSSRADYADPNSADHRERAHGRPEGCA